MAVAVIMPRQGQSVESCIITRWHKKTGDAVAVGDILFSYETDKAAFEEEAKEAGILLAVYCAEGDDVPVLTTVCIVGQAGEDISGLAADGASGKVPDAAGAKAPEGSVPQQDEPGQSPQQAPGIGAVVAADTTSVGENAKISPRARALAAHADVDPRQAAATGPNGRVIARDIQALLNARRESGWLPAAETETLAAEKVLLDDAKAAHVQPTSSAAAEARVVGIAADRMITYRDVPFTNMRKNIAKAMTASLQSMAQLTHTSSYDCSELMALRAKFKAGGESAGLAGVTLNDMILFAVSRTLLKHSELNAHRIGDSLRTFDDVHLGMAVDTPRGLMVPTIFFANRKSLLEISQEAKALATSCQKGNVSPDMLSGGTFTISNLGSLGIEHFTPVINPPQAGILGVNTITQRPREGKSGIELYPCMTLSLTYDHCALDGAPASRFLFDLGRNLEHFVFLMAQ